MLSRYDLNRTRIDVRNPTFPLSPFLPNLSSHISNIIPISLMTMDIPFFRFFFLSTNELGIKPVPETFGSSTEVVDLELSRRQAVEIFGASKVKGGNRMVSIYLSSMCVVFRSKAGSATAWVIV